MSLPRALVVSSRQRRLLALLNAVGGRAGNLDFQKLLFLYCAQEGDRALYDFVPYKFGAFSFTSYADRRKLIDRGLIEDIENSWQITTEGRQAIETDTVDCATFACQVQGLRGDALVAETYRRHPYTAIRSEFAARLLSGDEGALRRIDEARPAIAVRRLFTIGYEGRTLECYLNVLLRAGVTILCDVRRNPLSRKYGFSKKTLSGACEGVGIRYEHLPELGIPSEERRNLDTQADYDALFDEYERNSLPLQRASLSRIAGWIQAGAGVSLTCFEAEPSRCHRRCVAEAVECELGLQASHLLLKQVARAFVSGGWRWPPRLAHGACSRRVKPSPTYPLNASFRAS